MDSYKNEIVSMYHKDGAMINSGLLSQVHIESENDIRTLCMMINSENPADGQINSDIANFIKLCQCIEEMRKKKLSIPYDQLLVNYQIIPILFSLFPNSDNESNQQQLLFCMREISELQNFSISLQYLTSNFIDMFKECIHHEKFSFDFFLIYYNIMESINDQETFNQIVSEMNVHFWFDLMREDDFEPDILNLIFMILATYSKFDNQVPNDESLYYEIIAYYFFERRINEDRNILLTTTFPRNCIQIIANLISRESINFELFDSLHLFEFLNHYLQFPPIENHSKICQIIYLLIAKYHCHYPFDIISVCNIYLHEIASITSQYYSSCALNAMVQTDETFCSLFFQDNCELLFTIFDTFFSDISAKTKVSIAQLILFIISHADSEVWSLIFNTTILTNLKELEESTFHMSLFNFVSDSLEISMEDDVTRSLCISFLSLLFDKAAELGYLETYFHIFWEVFDENDLNDKFNKEDPQCCEFLKKIDDYRFP